MARACALGLDGVAGRLAAGDAVERDMWLRVLARAEAIVEFRNEQMFGEAD
jgi:hypothetical protein